MKQKGVTLIALVTTIIVLVILAGTSIATLTGDNGIIARAREAKENTEIAQIEEQLKLAQMSVRIKKEAGKIKESQVIDEFIKELENQGNKVTKEEDKTITVNDNYIYELTEEKGNVEWESKGTNGGSTTNPSKPEEPVTPEKPGEGTWSEDKKVNTPKLADEMTAVYWNESNAEQTLTQSSSQEEWSKWYDYKAGNNTTDTKTSKWANAKITKDGVDSYFVWIPRYEYKILSGEETSTAGKIEVKFIPTTKITPDEGYKIHPAFEDGSQTGKNNNFINGEWDSQLPGIWVGKYETSHSDATASVAGSSCTLKIVPGVTSWRNITIGDCYTTSYNYDRAKESHLMKNSEWGAVAYLTHSQYGRNGNEIDINNSSSFITGNGGGSTSASQVSGIKNAYNTAKGAKASTTGNIYGVYDLSGGASEYVASYISNGNGGLSNGSSFVATTADANGYQTLSTKNVTVYPYNSSSDTSSDNYNVYKNAKSTTYGYGDAILETSTGISTESSWFGDYSNFPCVSSPFFVRGSFYSNRAYAGAFYFSHNNGSTSSSYSFRVVLAVV